MLDTQGNLDAGDLAHTTDWQMNWYLKLEEPGLPCGSAACRCFDMVLQGVQVLKYKGPEMLVERGTYWLSLQSEPFHSSLYCLQQRCAHREW